MKPNKKDQANQPVDRKPNKSSVQNLKKNKNNSDQPRVIQDNQYGAKQKQQQQQNSTSPDIKKIAVSSGLSKEEMETATVEKDRSENSK